MEILAFLCFLLLWMFGCALCGHVASETGRSGVRWFFVGMFASPLLALIALTALPDTRRHLPKL